MAKQLIASMSGEWAPDGYQDEFRTRLQAVIRKKMKSKGAVVQAEDVEEDADADATTNVVDFMSLLRESIASNKRTPAKKASTGKSTAKTAKTAKKAAKKSAKPTAKKAAAKTKQAPAKKAAKRKSA